MLVKQRRVVEKSYPKVWLWDRWAVGGTDWDEDMDDDELAAAVVVAYAGGGANIRDASACTLSEPKKN